VRRTSGFTLIELVVVIAIIAILAAIALPSFAAQIRKARRSEVEGAIQQVALFQERFRADCTTYATGFGFACPTLTTLIFPANPYTSSYYSVTIVVANTDSTRYQIQALAVGTQANDTANGTPCGTVAKPLLYDFGVTATGSITKTPAPCWVN